MSKNQRHPMMECVQICQKCLRSVVGKVVEKVRRQNNGTVIRKFLAFLKLSKFLGNVSNGFLIS